MRKPTLPARGRSAVLTARQARDRHEKTETGPVSSRSGQRPPHLQATDEIHIEHFDWSRYNANHVVIKPALMSQKQLLEGYIRTYRSFYSICSIAKRAFRTKSDKIHTVAMNIGRKMNARYFEEGCRL